VTGKSAGFDMARVAMAGEKEHLPTASRFVRTAAPHVHFLMLRKGGRHLASETM
jgi:hypothetical protein